MVTGDYSGFTEATAPRHLVLSASMSVPLVVKLRDSPYRAPAFVHGAHGSHMIVDGECAPSYVEVRLAPLGAYALLGVPMDEINGRFVDMADLFGAAGRRLAEMVRDASTWCRRFALIDEFLLRRSAGGPRPSPEVERAWRLLVATDGAATIGGIAAEVGWSHKHLITRFKQQIGVSPKTAARLVRFHRTLERLDGCPAPRWQEIAADCGYADQAHLVREFREFTGAVPTRFLQRALDSGRVGAHAG